MPTYEVKTIDHLLRVGGASVNVSPECPNVGGALPVGTDAVPHVVVHYTAGPSREGAVAGFMDPARRASAHLVIGRDGEITQVVPFNRVAWHAGQSAWREPSTDPAGSAKIWTGLNHSAIGIELVNAGPLKKGLDQADEQSWLTWYGVLVDNSEVEVHEGYVVAGVPWPSHWQGYEEEQLDALVSVLLALRVAYPTLRNVLGHSEIAPGRKMDPGPAFPMDHVRAVFAGRQG